VHLPWREVAPGAGPAISTSITGPEAARLAGLADGVDVLEVGAAYGFSAVTMALGGARSVTSVDPHNWLGSYGPMLANLGYYGAEALVEVRQERFEEAAPVLFAAGRRFGLVFVDGDHSAAAVEHDLYWAEELLAEGGVIAVHDYGEDCCCPDVRTVCDQLLGTVGPDDVVGTLRVVRP
jgi:predicted O-methyltransferase YrrM